MGYVVLIVFVVIAGGGALLMFGNGIVEDNQNKLAEANSALVNRFGEGDYYVTLPRCHCIGIVWSSESLILGDSPATAISIPLADVRDADVEIDGVNVATSRSTTKTNRGSQLIGGAIGSLALGPAGFLVGGLTGSSTTTGRSIEKRKIKSVLLKLRVADRVAPLRAFAFFDPGYGEGHEADSPLVRPALERAAHYHALLTQVIEDRPLTT
jgi:hypothetical protein